jgi:hypothetical protein
MTLEAALVSGWETTLTGSKQLSLDAALVCTSIQQTKYSVHVQLRGNPEPANCIRQPSIMANGEISLISGTHLRRFGLRVLSAGCQGFRRHDGNRSYELRSLAVHPSKSIGGNNLDLWFLDRPQLRCLGERPNRDESRHGNGCCRSQENMRSAPVAAIGQRRVDRLP